MCRVEQLRLDNPERSRLFDIAKGMQVPLPEGFTPNAKGMLTPLRPAYVEVHQAVDKMLAQLHSQGFDFCLPKREAATRTRCTGPYARKVRVEDDPIHMIPSHDP